MLMAMSLARAGLSLNQTLPELAAHEQDDDDFAALMGLILGDLRQQQTPIETVSVESTEEGVRTNIVLGDSSITMQPAWSGETNSQVQNGSLAVDLTSQNVTAIPDQKWTSPDANPAGEVVQHSITSVDGRAVLSGPENHSAADVPFELSQVPSSRPFDAPAGDLSRSAVSLNAITAVRLLNTPPIHDSLNPAAGHETMNPGDVLTASASDAPTSPSTPEFSGSIPEVSPAVQELLASQETGLPSPSRSIDANTDSSPERSVKDAATGENSQAETSELDRVSGPRRSGLRTQADGQRPVSVPHKSELIANLHTESAVSAVPGSPSTFHFAESISAEMRQPLSTQVSRAVLDHWERPAAQESESLTLRLDPPELGEMVIELSKTRDGLAIRVSAREAVTMEMLFSRGHEIESHLRGRDVDLKSLEFLPSGSLGGQTSFEQHRGSATSQLDSVKSGRPTSRRGPASGAAGTHTGTTESESSHALNFRA
jgi:hypothetical protein